jgi:alpha-N-arabinofuranosidase
MSESARAVVDLDAPGATISRHLYGHFAEHLGRCIYGGFWVGEDSSVPHTHGIRNDVVEALRRLDIPNLRWPGGCFADEYHWRDGIGPRQERPRMVNSHWGDIVEDNAFGTHEFMQLCEMLGAEPYVSGNVGSGTVQEMSQWVEYLTRDDDSPMAALRRQNGRDEAWRVPFWGIGNEPWGCGGQLRPEAYVELARQYSTYLRDQSGNRLYKIAAGADAGDYGWTDALMKGMARNDGKPFFDAISFHQYTVPGKGWSGRGRATEFDTAWYYETLLTAKRTEERIRRHSDVMDVYDPDKTIGLVLDEWGTWWDVEPGTVPGFLYQQNTMRDALVASVHFDAFHRHADRLVMANIAQTVNVLQSVLLTDPETDELILTPTYHVFEMNRAHHDARSLDVRMHGVGRRTLEDGSELDLLSLSASTKDDEALISLSNLDATHSHEVMLDLRGRRVAGSAARLLTGDTVQAHNTAASPDAVGVRSHPIQEVANDFGHGIRIELPPHSYATVSLQLT